MNRAQRRHGPPAEIPLHTNVGVTKEATPRVMIEYSIKLKHTYSPPHAAVALAIAILEAATICDPSSTAGINWPKQAH